MTFGEKLQKLRKAQGLSQEELAGRLSVTRQTISKWELDQSTPELALLAQISDIFGITTDYLIKDAPAEAASAQTPAAKKPADRLALFIILLCIGGLTAAVIWILSLSAGQCEVISASGNVMFRGFMGYLVCKNADVVFFLSIIAAAIGLIGLLTLISKEKPPKEE